MKVSIKAAAQELGVREETLRRWEQEGKITSERTAGGHRRYDLAALKRQAELPKPDPVARVTLGYARVSSQDQLADLHRQVGMLEVYCATKGWRCEILQDRGSGLNYRKRGLRHLIQRIGSGEVERLVLTHQDRLLRFGAELVFALCEHFGTEVVIINATEECSFEEDLVQDVLEIITVFSARLYGSRSHKNKQVMEQLKEVANEIGGQDHTHRDREASRRP
jgi:putative resolvase